MEKYISVTSTNIKAVAYIKEHKELIIVFKNDKKYKYYDVPEKNYLEFLGASSKGKYLTENIKKNFECDKI